MFPRSGDTPIHSKSSLLKWHRQVNEIESQSSEWQYTNLRVFDIDGQAVSGGGREIPLASLLAKEACFSAHPFSKRFTLYQSNKRQFCIVLYSRMNMIPFI